MDNMLGGKKKNNRSKRAGKNKAKKTKTYKRIAGKKDTKKRKRIMNKKAKTYKK